MRQCPFCAEKIQDEAILCRYCGKTLISKDEGSDISKKINIDNQRNSIKEHNNNLSNLENSLDELENNDALVKAKRQSRLWITITILLFLPILCSGILFIILKIRAPRWTEKAENEIDHLGRIIYFIDSDNDNGVYAIKPTGKDKRKILDKNIFLMDVSPVSGLIAYIETGDYQVIKVKSIEGGGPIDIFSSENPIKDLKWSPDGNYLVFGLFYDCEYDVYLIDKIGSGLTHMGSGLYTQCDNYIGNEPFNMDFTWSHDQRLIIYKIYQNLNIIDVERSDVEHIRTFDGLGTIVGWNANNEVIIQLMGPVLNKIFIFDIDSRESKDITVPEVGNFVAFTVMSPNVNDVIYVQGQGTGNDNDAYKNKLKSFNINKLHPYSLVNIDNPKKPPLWSPDSEWIIVDKLLVNASNPRLQTELDYSLADFDYYFWVP